MLKVPINDLDFTLIEKRKKSSTVLLPEDWAKVIEFFSYIGIAPIKSLKHLFLLTTGQTGWMVLPWSLEGRQEKQKKGDLGKPNWKVYSPYRGLHNKKYRKVCLFPIFPCFHNVKRGHRGWHCGSNPLNSWGNGHPLLLPSYLSPLWH